MFSFGKLSSQVTIGSSNPPSPWSLLDLDNPADTDRHRALHLPRLDNDAREALTPNADAQGLMIFNTDTRCLEFWNSTEWISLCVDALNEPTVVGNVWKLRSMRYHFDPNTIPQAILDCLITNYGSIENFKNLANNFLEESIFSLFYFDENRQFFGTVVDDVAVWDFFVCWYWLDEAANHWTFFHPRWDDVEETLVCDGHSTGNLMFFELSGNRLYVIQHDNIDLSCQGLVGQNIGLRWEFELVYLNPPTAVTVGATPASTLSPTRTLQSLPFGLFHSR